jgi:hypothetical protein
MTEQTKTKQELPLKERFRPLTGRFFIAVRPDGITKTYCGCFLGLVSSGLYCVQIFRPDGTIREQLIPAVDMRFWNVFETRNEMETAYKA